MTSYKECQHHLAAAIERKLEASLDFKRQLDLIAQINNTAMRRWTISPQVRVEIQGMEFSIIVDPSPIDELSNRVTRTSMLPLEAVSFRAIAAAREMHERWINGTLEELPEETPEIVSARSTDESMAPPREQGEPLKAQIAYLREKLAERNRAIAALNTFLGWNATNACSGEDGCWCDAHQRSK